MAIKYQQYMRYHSLWFGGVLGLSVEEFKAQYGSQSGRIDFALAASSSGISVELWRQHGDWESFKSKKKHVKRDIKSILSVSLDDMDQPSSSIPIGNALDVPPDVRMDNGVFDSLEVVDDSIPLKKGIPLNIFS